MKKKKRAYVTRYVGNWPEAAKNAKETLYAINKKWYNIKLRYGLTEEEYKSMLHSSNGKCEICLSSTKLYVDHHHKSGKVRGLLCQKCNSGIAFFRESYHVLVSAIRYIKKHR